MIFSLLFIIFGLIHTTSTSELSKAMTDRCQLDADEADNFFIRFSLFTQKLKLAFRHACTISARYHELLRELDAPNAWLVLTTFTPTLLEDLKLMREEIIKKITPSKACSDWIDQFLGVDFGGSYLELMIKSLSATKNTRLAELSNKQLLSVRLELRRMHVEREYWIAPRSEELLEFYNYYVLAYMSLLNRTVGDAALKYAKQHVFGLTYITTEMISSFPSYSLAYNMNFFKRHVDPDKDFIIFKDQVYLRTSTNFTLVYQKWVAVLSLIPDVTIRREYFDEEKDVLQNFECIEKRVCSLYAQRNNLEALMEWDRNKLSNLTLAFDLVDSLMVFTRQKVRVTQVRRMLLEVMECIQRIMLIISQM